MKRHLMFAALSLIASAAMAEKADSGKPTTISAESVDIDDVNQVRVLTGNVELRRGTLYMRADRATIRETPDGWQMATMESTAGRRASFRQKRDGGGDLWVQGEAERIEYDQKDELVKMYAKANIKQLDGARVTDEVNGEFISYDSRKEMFAVRNDASGANKPGKGRVTLVMSPRKTAAPQAQPAAPAQQEKQ